MTFLKDLQHSWRSLMGTPTFFLVAVLSLALGIGANTALFSVLYATLFKQLPVDDPQLLVLFNSPDAEGLGIGASNGERGLMTWQEFQEFRQVPAFEKVFAVQSILPRLTVRIEGNEEEAQGKLVSGAYFATLRLKPQIGRFFDEGTDDQTGAAPYVVLSDNYYTARFHRDPSVVGRTLVVEKMPLTVVGVAPRGYTGESVGRNPDFWVPMAMQKAMMGGRDFLKPFDDPTLKAMWLHVYGRLRPGATIAQAQAQAAAIFKSSLEQSYASLSPAIKKQFMDQHLKLRPAATGASGIRQTFAESMYVVFAAVGAILLICCANISNLLLARANSREREMGLRVALGAGKGRIMQQMLTEGLLLCALGATAGLALSQVIAPVLMRLSSTSRNAIYLDASINWRVMLFAGGVAVLTTLLCSLAPAVRASRTELNAALREGVRGMTASKASLTASRLFVGAQVALSLILLVGAGLFLRSLLNLERVDLGYRREQVVLIGLEPHGSLAPERRALLYRQTVEALRARPDVQSVTFSENGLFSGRDSGTEVEVDGYTSTGKNDKSSAFDNVGPKYFSALGIPILAGREIDEHDLPNGPAVAVVNEAFAKQFFANRNPIGKHLSEVYGDQRKTYEIVGVARDSRDHSLREKVTPRAFAALLQGRFGEGIATSAAFEVRVRGNTARAATVLGKQVEALDSNARVTARPLETNLDDRLSGDRMIAKLVGAFGALALFLAAIGIYGVLAYGVSQRTGEIGIRMAIGAGSGDVIGMVLRETVWLLVGGLVVGVLGALSLARLVESKLYGVPPTDPSVMTMAAGALVLTALLAATIPAWRAASIDPADALRYE